ncbi:peroxide stress protein YaaA [Lewinella sp. W8]|uniref:peroxide stress protein YaaA n=1 Tax=Lewinella sp. W8 TaxID=2528208 RepID=UPI001067A88E|nr:peroxide stress protein YaaA [Lewinella sp. W8]MTB49855.1 peroxide stress protein YaaA [Lewinella sp. W8]
MIILLSPAKTLDMSPAEGNYSVPRLLNDTEKLAGILKKKSRSKLQELMSISESLADTNYQRFQEFSLPFDQENAKPAILAFRGDVYQDLDAPSMTATQLDFADQQIRILSGLYGLLRPRDLMQAYRLEMGTRLTNRRGKNLYEFWGNRITKLLNEDIAAEGSGLVLNLASQEYFKSVNAGKLDARVLTVHFKDEKDGKYRVIAFNAKRARGKMARLITEEGITQAEPLKQLVVNDYVYNEELSSENDWVWTR